MSQPAIVFALWGRTRDFSTWTVMAQRPFAFSYLRPWQRTRMAATPRRKQYPPRVDAEDYWTDPPPVVSERCRHWLKRIADGWRPGKRINHGYHGNAEFYGVYIWEYLKLIYPTLHYLSGSEARAVECPHCGAPANGPYWDTKSACRDWRNGPARSDVHARRLALVERVDRREWRVDEDGKPVRV